MNGKTGDVLPNPVKGHANLHLSLHSIKFGTESAAPACEQASDSAALRKGARGSGGGGGLDPGVTRGGDPGVTQG